MSKIKLFLGGGGDEVSAKEIDDLYGAALGAGAKVIYLPIAWEATATTNFETCLDWFVKTYGRFNFQIEMLTDLNMCDDDYLQKFDSIYIGGGNTFSLMSKLKESNFDGLLTDFINSGKVVYGGSAGAIILGKNINTASLGQCSDLNKIGLKDLAGLNMVGDCAIHCHYQKEDYLEIEAFSKINNIKVLALTEESGLYVGGDDINYIGEVTRFESES